jgi:hypothetical protein
MKNLRVVAVEQLLQILLHLLVVHLQLHALALELSSHFVDLGSVLLDLF